jgi:H+/gluconate symporter-like permease
MQNFFEKIRAALSIRKTHSDKGAGFVEYGAVILLVAAIAGVVLTQTGIPETINTLISDAVGDVDAAGDAPAEGEGDDQENNEEEGE